MTVRDVRKQRLSDFVGDGVYLNNGGNGYPGDGWQRLYFGNGNPTPIMMNGTDIAIDGTVSATTLVGALAATGVTEGDYGGAAAIPVLRISPDGRITLASTTPISTSTIGAQPVDSTLTALSGKATAADLLPYFTGVGAAATTTLTAFARTLLAGASASAMRVTLGALATNGDGSSLTATPTGGSVMRPVADMFAEMASAKNKGAVGDGTTDDTAAIQAALTAGGPVYLPPGSYKITSALNVPSNTWVYGAGKGATKLVNATGGGNVLVFGSNVTNSGASSLSVESASAATAGAAFYFNGCFDCWLRDFRAVNQHRAVLTNNAVLVNVAYGRITTPTATTGVGVLVGGTSGNDQYFQDVIVEGADGSRPAAGWRIEHTHMARIANCGAVYCGFSMIIAPASGQVVENLFVSDSPPDLCTTNSIRIEPASGGVVRRAHFAGCWSASSGEDNVRLTGAGTIDGVRFIGHRAVNGQRNGFLLENGKNVQIVNGSVAGNSGAGAASYDGIRVGAAIDGLLVQGVRIGDSDGFVSQQGYAVRIDAGANNVQIVGNDLRGNATGPLSDSSTGTKVISGNLPASVGDYTSTTSHAFPIGTSVAFTQTAVTQHAAGNSPSSMRMGINDGGGLTGIEVYNSRPGSFSEQGVRIWTAQGGVSVATNRLHIKPDGAILHRADGTTIFDANSLLGLRSYTVATLPSAGTAARVIFVSDGTSNKRLAVSDGTNWRWPDGAIVS